MSSLLVSPSAFDADRILDMDAARARFTERWPEFRARARGYFRKLDPESRDEAVCTVMLLAWRYIASMVRRGICNDPRMTDRLYRACLHVYRGRRGDGSWSRDLFKHIRPSHDFHVDWFIGGREWDVPTIVQFRLDTQAWLDSLPEFARQRALQLASGEKNHVLAKLWNCSRAAVSMYRQQLAENWRRFMHD